MPALPDTEVSPRRFSAGFALLCLVAMMLVSAIVFLTIGARGRWDFVLAFRGTKLAAMTLVGVAVALSAVLFQTIAQNRILTPSIMGFDALYGLNQTLIVFIFGVRGLGFQDSRMIFAIDAGVMIAFALLLYGWLLSNQRRSLHLMLLVGIVLGGLFRSLTAMIARVIDPNDFVVLQERLFANFNSVRGELLWPAGFVIAAIVVMTWKLLPRLDVMLLGREPAIGLGVDHRKTVMQVLALVAVLVSVSTALVGPITFLGLLVANLAYLAVPTYRHAVILPAAALIAIIVLVSGQIVLERVFGLNAALPIVIELVGGLVLIGLLIRTTKR